MSRRERPYLFYGATRAICSTCFMVCDAQELIEGDKVFLWKRCLTPSWDWCSRSGSAQASRARF